MLSGTLFIFYKRQPIRYSRQIVDKNKRHGLAFSKKLRDSPFKDTTDIIALLNIVISYEKCFKN